MASWNFGNDITRPASNTSDDETKSLPMPERSSRQSTGSCVTKAVPQRHKERKRESVSESALHKLPGNCLSIVPLEELKEDFEKYNGS